MHWNGLLVDVVGLVLIGVGVYFLRSGEARREFRADWRRAFSDGIPIIRIVGLLPGGFVLYVVFGLWMVVDGIYHVYHGHPMWPF
jgi:glucose uptake protein GlcU